MTDTITLRRAAEKARSALNGWANHGLWAWPESALQTCKQNTEEALAALDAALAEPDAIARAVEAEREACARIADSQIENTCILTVYPGKSAAAWNIANAIRARGSNGTPA